MADLLWALSLALPQSRSSSGLDPPLLPQSSSELLLVAAPPVILQLPAPRYSSALRSSLAPAVPNLRRGLPPQQLRVDADTDADLL